MQLKSPCLRCKRKDEAKNKCIQGCLALQMYNEIVFDDMEDAKAMGIITKELDELAKKHADKIESVTKKPITEETKIPKKRGKRGNYQKKEKADPGTGQARINSGQADDIIVLDLSEYQQIDKYLTEYSDKMMLPKEHIIMSLVGEALAAKIDRGRE